MMWGSLSNEWGQPLYFAFILAVCLGLNVVRFLIFSLGAYALIHIYAPHRIVKGFIPGYFLSRENVKKDILNSIPTILVFSVYCFLTFLLHFAGYSQIYTEVGERGILYFFFSIFGLFVMHDTYFYWAHRALHIKWMYKKFHWIHHTSINPTPFSCQSFHVVEAILEGVYIPLSVLILPINIYALLIFHIYTYALSAYGHSGLEFSPPKNAHHPLAKYLTTSTHHFAHHRINRCNFSLYFTYWDRIMGTSRR